MKMKILSVVSIVLCLAMAIVTGCSSAPEKAAETTAATEATTAAAEPAPVSPTANEVAKAMGIGLNLGNTMEAYEATDCEKITFEWIPVVGNNTPQDYETCWGAIVTTQEIIDGIKAAGFDTVRIPVFWGNMMKNDGTYTINADYIGRVKEIVDYAQKAGLYTVINMHHFDEFIIRRNDVQSCKEIISNLWTQIAEYFKDYPYTVVFEGFNEYLGGNQFDENGELKELPKNKAYELTNTLNQAFVDSVRKTGGNNAERTLIISGYWTNIDNTTSDKFLIPTDSASDRLMVSVHYVDNSMYWQNSIGGDKWLEYIDSQCDLLTKAFTEKNIPVFLGETTSYYPKSNFASNATHTDSTECLEIVFNKLLERGFVPVLWDVCDNFYSRTDCKISYDEGAALVKKISDELHKGAD